MEVILDLIKGHIDIISLLIIIILLLLTMYNKIKYLCLEKAVKKIAEVESLENLTGEEKFALVTKWITEKLPKVFCGSLFLALVEKLIQYAYDNSLKYAKNYIKRKTGLDISEILKQLDSDDTSDSEDS